MHLLYAELETLRATVRDYEAREREWQMRWQRIAYHLRSKGISVSETDRPIAEDASPPHEQGFSGNFEAFR